MDGHELGRPEEEEYLLPPSKGATSKNSAKTPPAKANAKAPLCKLPWFGSWSATLLVWVVGSNSLIFWSLPSSSFAGRLSVVRKLWSVNKLETEDLELKSKLKSEEDKNAELQKDVGQTEEIKGKLTDAQSASTRLRSQLKDVQSQLDAARAEARKHREDAAEQRRGRTTAEGELSRLRTQMSDSSRAASAADSAKAQAERSRDSERQRADRLAAKLKKLRDAELPLLKDEDGDLK